MMTRKDYISTVKLLNATIADSNSEWGENSHDAYVAIETVMLVAEKFVELFQNDNSNFDSERFFNALEMK
jgi:hypothetical protein